MQHREISAIGVHPVRDTAIGITPLPGAAVQVSVSAEDERTIRKCSVVFGFSLEIMQNREMLAVRVHFVNDAASAFAADVCGSVEDTAASDDGRSARNGTVTVDVGAAVILRITERVQDTKTSAIRGDPENQSAPVSPKLGSAVKCLICADCQAERTCAPAVVKHFLFRLK